MAGKKKETKGGFQTHERHFQLQTMTIEPLTMNSNVAPEVIFYTDGDLSGI